MSNDIISSIQNDLAIIGGLDEDTKAVAGGGLAASKRISIKGGVFRLLAGGKEVASIEDRHLDVVIVKAAPKVSRVFYAAAYDGDKIAGPDCWSNDGEMPDASIKEPQGSSCAKCPQNIAGSGNGNSRACRFQQRLAVVLENDMNGEIMQLTLPATSIFGKEEGDKRPLQAYARYLAAQNINPETLVTQLRFDTKAAVPKLFFKPVRWLEDDEYAVAVKKGESTEAKMAVTMSVAKPAEKAPQLEGKKPSLKKEEPAVEAEEVDEPEKRKPAAKATAVPKKEASNLAKTVEEWDDE